MAINDVLDPTTTEKITSNVSYFIFSGSKGDVQRIYPRSYHKALLYIHGRRKFQNTNLSSSPDNAVTKNQSNANLQVKTIQRRLSSNRNITTLYKLFIYIYIYASLN